MVEITKKYKIGSRRFGVVNWVGAWTLYKKEVLRFLIVWVQTIFSPLISSLLFLLVLSLAIGADRGEVLGVPFITFLAPGLISMQVIQQSFSHSSSSFMIGKIQGNIVDLLYAPLSASEVTISVSLAAVTRSVMIAIVSIIVFKLLIDIEIKNYLLLIIFTLLSSFILGNIGIIAGLWAEKFDHMATVTNFVIVPLSFLSGTFYSINRLPEVLQIISKANPFFYMIDGFRYSFIGKADGSILVGLLYLTVLSFVSWFVTYILYKKGYKIKS
ncbi:ABC transporter permease [Candidatus Pelagibacter bacterium]|jgi:ABC-2 type transport system permease protein|nr:ABC transporter permease [Candidatus Pelagibacter bacterium]|tara:strand:- start:60 stop:872 length:813 start_codon:yes stop_codon:yes gene_type:complete